MAQEIKKIFSKQLPNWIRDISYGLLVLETVTVVIIYFKPDFWLRIIDTLL